MNKITETNKLEHPCFPQPEDTSVSVWRYMDLAKFIWLLENKALYLPRIDLLNDPHEGSITRANYQAREEFYSQKGLAHILPGLSESTNKLRKSVYVNCWHLNNEESEAMWKLYCGDKDGIAIKTSYQTLVDSIENISDLYIGKVSYINYENDWIPQDNIFSIPMHKRLSYSFENEVRLVRTLPEYWHVDSPEGPVGITAKWDINKGVHEIFVNPYADEWYFHIVEVVISKIYPEILTKLHWSKMKSTPMY